MDSDGLIRAMPKVEQHVHIVGSTRPETLLWLADESGVDIKCDDLDDVRELFQYRDFPHFIQVYSMVNDCINDERQFERVVYEMLETEARCSVWHVEAIFSAHDHVRRGLDYGRMLDAINAGIRRAHRKFGVGCTIRIDLVRNYGPDVGMKVLDLIDGKGDNVVSIDIGGSEEQFPPKPYAPVFRRAKQMGLHLVAHAGEAARSQSIIDAVNYLNVERIGHGVAAAGDRNLINHLKERGITVEACPISNIRTGVVSSFSQHPIREFFDSGLRVTVNSDDPSMFGTDMNNEYIQIHRELGFTLPELFMLSLHAVESSFLPDEDKHRMIEVFNDEFKKLMAGSERFK